MQHQGQLRSTGDFERRNGCGKSDLSLCLNEPLYLPSGITLFVCDETERNGVIRNYSDTTMFAVTRESLHRLRASCHKIIMHFTSCCTPHYNSVSHNLRMVDHRTSLDFLDSCRFSMLRPDHVLQDQHDQKGYRTAKSFFLF